MKTSTTAVSHSQNTGSLQIRLLRSVFDQILSDPADSRREIAEGKGIDPNEALLEIGRDNRHMF